MKLAHRSLKGLIVATTTAIVMVIGSCALSAASASAATPPVVYSGVAPGAITCNLKATIKIRPPISHAGGGTSPSLFSGKLSDCGTSNGSVQMTSGKLTGSFSDSPLVCAGLSASGASATLTIAWKGDLNGALGGTTYREKAHFTNSTLSSNNEQVVTNGGDVGLALPGNGPGASSIATGSFAGASTATVLSSLTPAALSADCNLGHGVKRLAVTGTVTVGSLAPVPQVIDYSSPSINSPEDITVGPDGALWFANARGGYGTLGSIGRITASGVVTNYTDPSINEPLSITVGPDGALWFTNFGNNSIGRITTGGAITNFTATGLTINDPDDITTGPDGALWFTNYGGDAIGRITTSGSITDYTGGAGVDEAVGITAGPDGALWFTNAGNNSISRITTSGTISNYTGGGISGPAGITAGPDGALWFTNQGNNSIGSITTSGTITNYTDPSINGPTGIATGLDGALWFTNFDNNSIGRVTAAGVVTDYTNVAILNPHGITAGPDGAMWFTNTGVIRDTFGSIGRVTLP